MEEEIWKDIPGYDYKYQISSFGRLRNTNPFHNVKGRSIKTGSLDKKGYLRTELTKNGKKIGKKIHRLVAEYFIEGYSEDLTVNHKDFDKANNKVNNLEILTQAENALDYVIKKIKTKSSSRHIGVSFSKRLDKWLASIRISKKKIHIGTFKTEIEAFKAIQKFKTNTGMKKQLNLVEDFHKAFGHPINNEPTLLPIEVARLRYELMKEENEEYLEACETGNIVELADALGDKLYILCGTLLAHGLQDKIEAVFEEIQRSNMSKLGADGQPIYREDGKIMKGENYSKPNIRPLI